MSSVKQAYCTRERVCGPASQGGGVHAIAHACIEMQRPARFFARMHEMRSKSHACLRASSYLSLESLTFLLATLVALHPRTH
jgi:hypothetical protein